MHGHSALCAYRHDVHAHVRLKPVVLCPVVCGPMDYSGRPSVCHDQLNDAQLQFQSSYVFRKPSQDPCDTKDTRYETLQQRET